ncbi:MAG: cobalamin B12-binding domain-containing protein [Anaerolineae bacterium]
MTDKQIRVLIAKPGLDGHDRGAKVVALALRDAGFAVTYTGLHRTVDQIVETVQQKEIDVIGLSILSGAHIPITEKLMERLREEGLTGKMVLVGGNVPERDFDALKALGVAAVFHTGSKLEDIVDFIRTAHQNQ